MKNRLTELLGMATPISCGGLMRVGTVDLADSASNPCSPEVIAVLLRQSILPAQHAISFSAHFTSK